jgi:hypothetical protein
MTIGPTSEIWCGSKKVLNASLYQELSIGFTKPVCESRSYWLEIRANEDPRPVLQLHAVTSGVGYFACFDLI